MIFPVFALLLLQSTTVTVGMSSRDSAAIQRRRAQQDTMEARADSLRKVRDSIAAVRRRERIIPVTPQLIASAFRDSRARALLERARAARFEQDSALASYMASTYERLSVNMKIRQLGRERLLFRTERTARVQWDRNKGAVIAITGLRGAAPIIGENDNTSIVVDDQVPIPYYPGRNALWVGSGLAKANVEDTDIINPIANGAEAYYTYRSGDSLSFQTPGGDRVTVRELVVRPRAPSWRVVVGSLWFEVGSGQLVRAIYRLSEPIDVLAEARQTGDEGFKDIPMLLRPFITPISGKLDVITIDYGLFEGRFWLPSYQIVEGGAELGVVKLPLSLQQRFEYSTVNGTINVPDIQFSELDTTRTIAAIRAQRLLNEKQCINRSNTRERRERRYDKTLNVLIQVPCDEKALEKSSMLPPSIFSANDSMFRYAEVDALIADALGIGSQSAFEPQPMQFSTGFDYVTYNRVEGLAVGAELKQSYGSGYTGRALFRFGTADLQPKGELSLSRTNGRQTLTGAAYARLAVANDWGNFFNLGSSLTAALFGRDEGMYYKSWGGELRYETVNGLVDSWRLFGESHSSTRVHSQFSVAHELKNRLRFAPNITAQKASEFGLAARRQDELGENPMRPRLTSDVRLEAATGTFDYVRAMADVTLSSPLARRLDGALTLSGGSTGGTVPVQRLWFIGGTHTVRGQSIGSAVGDAYWFSRAELAYGASIVRTAVFGDIGWAGPRNDWRTNVRPVSGAGVGFSFLDGAIRFDLAKGIRPDRSIRGYLYLDARF